MPPRTFVAFDLETTGLNPKRDAIIEFGAVRFQSGRPREYFSSCINPGRPLPVRIQQITGIRPADVADAPSIDDLLPEIIDFLGNGAQAVVAHSAGFDVSFLRAAGLKLNAPVLDTYELATILLPGQDSYSLGELCRSLEIPLTSAHRASHDAEATAELLLRLLERIKALPDAVLEALSTAGRGSDWGPLLLIEDELRSRKHTDVEEKSSGMAGQVRSSGPPLSPLTPDPSPREIADRFLVEAFSDGGPLAAEFDAASGAEFERRDGQLQMSLQTLDALNRGDHRIIEAGTGTGKSLAYLLPAAAWAVSNQSRVVIATHTLPLQDQLLEKELPRVTRALAALDLEKNGSGRREVRAMALKGRSRYLCTRRLAAWLNAPRGGGGLFAGSLPPLELRFLAKLLVWLPHTQTGDLSELPIHDRREQALMPHVASHADECSLERCAFARPSARCDFLGGRYRDFYLEAHRQASSAHLLVVNHALLLADIAAGGQVLPEYDSLIVDEAHHLEGAATEQFTRQMDLRGLVFLLDRLEGAVEQLAARLGQDHLQEVARKLSAESQDLRTGIPPFAAALHEFVLRHSEVRAGARAASGFPQQVALDSRMRAQPAWSEIEIEWDGLSGKTGQVLGRLTELADRLDASQWWQWQEELGNSSAPGDGTAHALQALHYGQADLADLLQVADDVILRPLNHQEESVAWLELPANPNASADGTPRTRRGADAVILRSAPVQVSGKLDSELFSKKRAVVLTGATLQAGDHFDYLRDRLGCWDANGAVIDSPFDYKRNALLYLPSDMPPPDHHNFQQALEQAVQQAALAAEGRTLVLFTSHSHLRASADAIRTPLAAAGLTVIQQGEGSRSRNLRDFRANPASVLLGTSSYWEGIDLPGDQLVCLIIARLPFAVPTDPLYAARSSLYEDAFYDYAVPEAVLRLRQGFGRLIRSAADRGVVVLLDSRLWQRSYGELFLDALPDCTRRSSPLSHLGEAVHDWLNRPAQLSSIFEPRIESDAWDMADEW
ncbi:MAG: exonuclease domain-containing protein [Caldilineaceae bacterium]|nr:exonuclease domain-containing protein [Caldilineaceae bacterium]MDE0336301.1 exonuclease domain-containing protein [Caldilineaceae bacterium]